MADTEVRNTIQVGLDECEECHCTLVQPIDWEEETDFTWHVTLRCPNCWNEWEGVFDQDLLDEYDSKLDDDMEAIGLDLAELAKLTMTEDVELFVKALKADAIYPIDF